MINMDKFDFFIFDCDGVILDSNKLKSNAFAEALSNEPPNLVAEFVQYHKQNGGISRYEKFKYYFEDMKKQVDAEIEIINALNNFASIVSVGLLKCNYIPGVVELIGELFNLNKRLFVVSGSDEKELIQVFRQRGIDHYFENIYGSPDNKIKNTRKVISSISTTKNGLFFGDSKSDYNASKAFGLDFVFVKEFSEWDNGGEIINTKYTVKNFDELLV
jgi:phosphoglycolate phosphatase-like HAD superfamily hydrolase